MPILSHPAFGPRAALVYITLGSLIDIWVGVWYFVFVMRADPPPGPVTYFWLLGLFLTGLTLLLIGVLLGRIGQAARRAELPPPEALPAEAAVQQAAGAAGVMPGAAVPGAVVPGAMHPAGVVGQPVAPVAPAAPMAVPPGQVVVRR